MPDFVPTFWNTLTQHNVGSRTSKVSGGQVAYKKKGYAWDFVNNDILGDFSASSFPGNVQLPRLAQDWVDIHFDSEYSAKRQTLEGDWCNSEDEFFMRLRTDAPTNSTGIIHPSKPWQVVYYDAFGKGQNLIYGLWQGKTARFEHVIEITEVPSGDSEYLTYDFYIESKDATAFVGSNHDQRPWSGNTGDAAPVQGFDIFLAKGDDPATPRGAVIRVPVCWWTGSDGSVVKKPVRVDFEIESKYVVRATKYVKRSDVVEALSQGSVYRADVTFNPDASPETSTVDGYTRKSNGSGSWSDLVTGAGNIAEDSWSNKSGPQATYWAGDWTSVWRLWAGFDTSSIGAEQQIDTASLTLYKYNHQGPSTAWDSELLNVYEAVPASDTALAAGDHANMATTALSDTGITNYRLEHDAGSTAFAWAFNTAGLSAVDPEGLSQLGIAYENDRSNTSPPVPAGNTTFGGNFYMAEQSGTSLDPTLTVAHSAAASGSPHYYYQNNQHVS